MGAGGKLISIEGLDGAGKSTVVSAIADVFPNAVFLREPGGSKLSEFIRAVLKGLPLPSSERFEERPCDRSEELLLELRHRTGNSQLVQICEHSLVGARLRLQKVTAPIEPEEELLLFNAARAQLVNRHIRPALEVGEEVILDRFIDSTVAYQGFGRGMDPDAVRRACLEAAGGLEPALTVYLRISPQIRQARTGDRGEEDRIERSGDRFFARVAGGFDQIAAENPDRFVVIDGEQSPAAVAANAVAAVRARV